MEWSLVGSKCFLRSGSESEGWPSDWIFKNQFEKVNIRMEEFFKIFFWLWRFMCDQGFSKKTMDSESRTSDKGSRNMLSVALNELFGSFCFLSLGCSWFCNMGMPHGMQILRMDGGFKVICDHMEDHHVMKFLVIQFGICKTLMVWCCPCNTS